MNLPTRDQFKTDEEFIKAVYEIGKKDGREKKSDMVLISFYIHKDTKATIDEKSNKKKLSLSAFMRKFIDENIQYADMDPIEFE